MPVLDGDYSEPGRNANLRNKKYPVEDYLDPDMELDYAKSHGGAYPDYVADHVDNYRALRAVLEDAFNRCAFGKGKSRHARGNEKFEDQYILRGARSFGIAGLYFQLGKKLEESLRLLPDQRINELLDCIIYAAAAVILTKEGQLSEKGHEDKAKD